MSPSTAITAAEFKERCLKLMDDVQASGRSLIITKRGKPVAKLVPFEESVLEPFGHLAGTVTVHGDIIEPIDEIWNADHT